MDVVGEASWRRHGGETYSSEVAALASAIAVCLLFEVTLAVFVLSGRTSVYLVVILAAVVSTLLVFRSTLVRASPALSKINVLCAGVLVIGASAGILGRRRLLRGGAPP
jgi:hypothetical protein